MVPRKRPGLTLWVSIAMGLAMLGLLLALPSAVIVTPREAGAIPAFARKYQTSCSTCHVAFPTLTPFGDAYRNAGYRFPAGEEEDSSWDEPVPLGQQAHRQVFPDAIWPGSAPGAVPLTATMSARSTFIDDEGDFEASFANLGARVGLTVAGALDDTFSAWAGVAVGGETDETGAEVFEAELERVFLRIHLFDEPTLNLRIGRMEPSLTVVTAHRNLGPSPWLISSPVGDNPFTIDPAQTGIEATGIIGGGRLAYSAGFADATGDGAVQPDDGYVRVAYKVGGMRLDGVGGAADSLPWRDGSVQFGAFGMLGSSRIGDPELAVQTDDFWLAGGDVRAIVWDLTLTAGYSYASHDRPLFADPDAHLETHQVLTQVDWVAYPWLVPTLRYELRSEAGENESRILPSVFFLIRQNVRGELITTIGNSGGHFELNQLQLGLTTAF